MLLLRTWNPRVGVPCFVCISLSSHALPLLTYLTSAEYWLFAPFHALCTYPVPFTHWYIPAAIPRPHSNHLSHISTYKFTHPASFLHSSGLLFSCFSCFWTPFFWCGQLLMLSIVLFSIRPTKNKCEKLGISRIWVVRSTEKSRFYFFDFVWWCSLCRVKSGT